MKKLLLKILRPIKYRLGTKKIMKPYFRFIEKNLASNGNSLSKEKMRSSIMMQAHIIEKGLSLADVKPWFGQPKIYALISDTKSYFKAFGDKKLLYWVVSMLQSYIDYNRGKEGTPVEIITQFDELKKLLNGFVDDNLKGGFVEVDEQDNKLQKFDYKSFAKSRHSIRIFTGEPIDVKKIKDALEIAECTPSACNRQPWYNYVVTDRKKIDEILTIQCGSRQFKNMVSGLIITSSSAYFFFENEFNQMYFNTGLYAMNLLLALHSVGIGTIPLNLGIKPKELEKIEEICGIPNSQMPISLIAMGVLPKHYKYARSARFSFIDYTTFV